MNNEMKVSEAAIYVTPEIREVITGMVSEAGVSSDDITVGEILKLYPHDNPNVTRDKKLALLALAFSHKNKYSAKLTVEQRCEVLALHRKGLGREVLARMYGVDRRTVTHITNPNSTHYKSVREREMAMGESRFADAYLTPELLSKALQFNQPSTVNLNNNKHASGKEGLHVVRGTNCEYDHRVKIQWKEPGGDIQVAGWYYQDLDGDFPDRWFSSDEQSTKTSLSCYAAMLNDITDRMGG